MIAQWFLIFPLALQGLVLLIDEFFFHHRRGLPLWEIVGHPVDSVSVLITLLWTIYAAPTGLNLLIYALLSVFSCFLVTKDEWIHTQLSSAEENWLHAVLFILHPLVFVSAGFIWWGHSLSESANFFDLDSSQIYFLKQSVLIQCILISIFTLYQLIYWPMRHIQKKRTNDHAN